MRYGEEAWRDIESALGLEWLETNGLGGYASSTIVGLNVRRYHGLLVAATQPPAGRYVLLAKLEETLVIDGSRFDLSANRFGGATHPQGHRYLKEFRLDPFPVFLYEAGGVTVEKSVFMVHGENTTVTQYELRGGPAALEVRPLVTARDYHSLLRWNGAWEPQVESQPGLAAVQFCPDRPRLYLAHNAGGCQVSGHWYYDLEYERERERGFDSHEDLFNPLLLTFSESGSIIASTEPRGAGDAGAFRRAEIERRRRAVAEAPVEDEFARALAAAADQFIVERGPNKSVIAGYPWFGDWGRDAMIALPGLTLTTGRVDDAKSILRTFGQAVDRGMLPNRFPESAGPPEYNTVDATLWFFEATRAVLERSGDYDFVRRELYDVLVDIVAWHERGTRYGIRVDADGLLGAGEAGVQLTWMDASVGERMFTPRRGKAVEVQALWHNALCILARLAQAFGHDAGQVRYREMALRARRAFEPQFWNEAAGCLYDVVDGERRDASIRPNQILAVSLPYSMLSPGKALAVVTAVERHLLTPFGLRTLAPDDPCYRGRYEGDALERDAAYHQGAVWPWLLGPFVTAYIKVHDGAPEARRRAMSWLEALRGHLREAGLGQISELFDGDPPHRPGGCIAQAWSVAELLRVLVEEASAP